VQVLFVAKEHPCPLRDYMEAECKNLVGLVNRMKDRLVRSEKPLSKSTSKIDLPSESSTS
jgi:hypothetical protein